jgi:prepilin-type N-terminal cleavage/methylation domain-containing protein
MKSRRTSIHNGLALRRGFTLIEILIVTAIMTLVAGLGLFMGLDSYRRSQLRNEEGSLVGLLERARNRAMNNFLEMPHGVHFDSSPPEFVLFEGASYAASDPATREAVSRNAGITVNGFTDVVFDELSGDANPASTTISLYDGTRSVTIAINAEGQINW